MSGDLRQAREMVGELRALLLHFRTGCQESGRREQQRSKGIGVSALRAMLSDAEDEVRQLKTKLFEAQTKLKGIETELAACQSTAANNLAEDGQAASSGNGSAHPPEGVAFEELFQRIDTDADGVVTMADFSAAVERENAESALLSGSPKVRSMLEEWDQGKGNRDTLTKEEFTTAMKQLFLYQYRNLVSSCSFDLLFAQTMVDNLEHPMLCNEARELQPLRSLRRSPQDQIECLVEFVVEKLRPTLCTAIASLFRAAAQYERQEEVQSSGKFHEMVLGASETFDLGPEGLFGLPGSDVHASIEREHCSAEPFTAWNNGAARTTSAAAEFKKALPHGWAGRVNPYDYQEQMDLCVDCNHDFMQHRVVVQARLSKAEVVVLRMYTGPLYKLYNGSLRSFLPKMEEELGERRFAPDTPSLLEASKAARDALGTPFATTIHVLVSAIQKLRRENPLPEDLKVYRGFAGLALPPRFTHRDRKGSRGGVEFGFMSTSTSKQQALGYIRFEKGMPRLFEMEVGHIDRGADLAWVSYFPCEAEVLMPPLSGVEVRGEPHYETLKVAVSAVGSDGQETTREEERVVQVWRIGLNVNVKGKTMEEHRGARKQLFLKAAEEGSEQVRVDLEAFEHTDEFEACAQRDVFLSKDGDEKEKSVRLFRASVLDEWQEQLALWDAMAADRFNQPQVFNAVYGRLLEMLRLVQLKKRLWLRQPEQGLPNIAQTSLKDAKRRGLAANRRVLQAASSSAEQRLAAAQEQLQFRGVVGSGLEELTEGESALHRASAEGDVEVAELLLAASADAGRRTASEETALILAARAGSDSICATLLRAGVHVEAVESRVGGTALYWAAAEGYASTVKLLIAHAADVNHATHCLSTPLGIAAYYGHLACVKALIEAGSTVDARKDTGSAPLYLACQHGHAHVVQALVEAKCDVDLPTGDGATPLYVAANDNHLEVVKRLIAAKCEVDKATTDGSSPLFVAASHNHVEVIDLLMAANCDVHKATNEGAGPLFVAAQKNHVEVMARLIARCDVDAARNDGCSPLYVAALHNSLEAVERLIAARCDVDKARDGGFTPLFAAAQEGNLEVMRCLLAAGCDPNKAALQGTTPLLVAFAKNHMQAMNQLIEAKCDVNKALDDGCTPLFVAARDNNTEAMDRLLAARCDVDKAELHGSTPLMVACQNNCVQALERLIAANCDVEQVAGGGTSALHIAAEHNRTEAVVRLIAARCGLDNARDDGFTPLCLASAKNQVEVVEGLIAARCDVDKANSLGFSPLSCAAEHDNVEAMERLIAAKCNVDKAQNQGATPLFVACQKGHVRAIERLLAANCNIDQPKEGGATPLCVATLHNHVDALDLLIASNCDVDRTLDAGASPLFLAAQENRIEAMGRLIAAKCCVNTSTMDGATPLYIAAVKGNLQAIDLLVASRCDVDQASRHGFTPLFMAAQEGHLAALDRLIAARCDVDKPTSSSSTPLVVAALQQRVEAVTSLIAAGADRTVLVGAGRSTPLQLVQQHAEDSETRRALEALLHFQPWEVPGSTALHRAAVEDDADAVRRLTEHSCDVDALNARGRSALHLAASSNSAAAACALLAAGSGLHGTDQLGSSALAIAAVDGHTETAEALVAAKADPSACDQAGRSALVLAAMAGRRGEGLLGRLDPALSVVGLHWSQACAAAAPAVLLTRGFPSAVRLDAAARSVQFSSFSTLCCRFACPAGRKAAYELTVLDTLREPQIGFATRGFEPCLGHSSDGVGDDEESWGFDGQRLKLWSQGGKEGYNVSWKEGDVIGLACDLTAQRLTVSVNGVWEHAAVFDLADTPAPSELFPAFSAAGGRVQYNFGEDGRELVYGGELLPVARAHASALAET